MSIANLLFQLFIYSLWKYFAQLTLIILVFFFIFVCTTPLLFLTIQPYWGNRMFIVVRKAGWTVSVRELIVSPPLEHSAAFSGSHLWFISDDLCCTNKNGSGHWFRSRGSRFPPVLALIDRLVGRRDNIVADLCVSSKKKMKEGEQKEKATITMSCWSHWFSFDASKLARRKFNFEVLITFPCSLCPISPVNLQGFSSPITQHQGYFFPLTVCLCVQTLSKLLWLTDLCVD